MAAVVPVWWAVLAPADNAPPGMLWQVESGVADFFRAIRRVETGLLAHPEATAGTAAHGALIFQCTRQGDGFSWEQVPGPGHGRGHVRAWRP